MRPLLLIGWLCAAALAGEPVRLTVLATNDLHGQLDPLPPSPMRTVLRGRRAGGFAHLAALVHAIRREGPPVLLFDSGDVFQGTPIGNETRGYAVIDAMNALGYDAGALGNHEFDYGFKNMARLVARARFPILAANVSGARVLKAYAVMGPPKVPCRIAVIGLLTPGTPRITSPGVVRGLRFADPVPVVRALLKEVEADLFIVLSHLGRDEELRLAREVEGLALVCGGHSHTPYVQTVGTTLVMQTEGRGVTLARADLALDPDGWSVVRSAGRLLPVDPAAAAPDPAVQRVIDGYGKDLKARLGRKVGTLAAPLRRQRGPVSSSAGNWIADALRRAAGADVAFMNKGGIRTDLEAGDVTAGDVYRLMPFDNTLVAMDLTGNEVRTILERTFRPSRFPGLEWSGLVVTLADGRVAAVEVGGRPLDDRRVYRVATNSFMGAGGDGYDTFRRGRNVERGALLREVLAEALATDSPLTPPDEQRVRTARPAR